MQDISLLIGTYTTQTASRGVYRLRVCDGQMYDPQLVLETRDPSYLLRRDDALYWVDEALGEPTGRIGCAQRSGDVYVAQWLESTAGENPCHLAHSPSDAWLAAANYSSGEVAIFHADGLSAGVFPAGTFSSDRCGINPARQEGPHAHFVSFRSENELLCCDLGSDCLRRLVCTDGHWHETAPVFVFPNGSGPRHMLIVNDIAYVLCELSCELLTIDLVTGTLLSTQYMLHTRTVGTAAALRLSARGELLASHRGADTISLFSLENPRSPALSEVISCGGKGPRDFLPLADGSIVCACQQSNTLTLLSRDDRGLRVTQTLALDAPVCVIAE